MKKILSWMVLGLWMIAGSAARAQDSTAGGAGVSTPGVSATPAAKHKKKAKKKPVAVAKVYVCPMDGYTSDKPGKCPRCGMDLVEKQ